MNRNQRRFEKRKQAEALKSIDQTAFFRQQGVALAMLATGATTLVVPKSDFESLARYQMKATPSEEGVTFELLTGPEKQEKEIEG